ncbi:peptide-methionine (S)-S-oxide reductase MsrA, partial [Oenococcus oeni]
MTKNNREEILNDIYNLILNPATSAWERSLLSSAKNAIGEDMNFERQLSKLEFELRPLAVRNNLTADVTDFYMKITGNSPDHLQFDFSKHYAKDLSYQDRAIFAGGCFWCMVEPFENERGIVSVLSGYTGGHVDHPTYEQVVSGYTGHVEAVEIIFDTRIIQYTELLDLYWQITDPTDEFGQINDHGDNYRPVIFVRNEEQRKIAESSKLKLAESGMYNRPIVTAIEPATKFWPAENFHQQFY